MKNEIFEVATFESMEATAQPLEGNLPYDDAIKLANETFDKGDTFGVMVVSCSPESDSPIKWIKTLS